MAETGFSKVGVLIEYVCQQKANVV